MIASVLIGARDLVFYQRVSKIWERKVPRLYSAALPIRAKTGRERVPENARSLTDRRDDDHSGRLGQHPQS